jgi:putative transposase
MLTLIDESTRESLAIRVARRPGSYEMINNGPGSLAGELRRWVAKLGTRTLYLEPGSP